MIYLRADGHKATITKDLPITTGSVGLQVEVSLSEDFDGLASVVTFRAGTVVADVAYVGELVEVPPQVMTKPNTALLIGVYAQSADGRTVIPTVWDNAGIIQPGTLPDDFPQPDPAPSWAAQVQLWAQEAHETAEALAEDVSEWGVAEDGRVAAEQSRVSAESARVQAESARASAETARVNAETARAQAETEREDAESVRSSLETLRVQAESEREGAESERVEAESSRTAAESARASAEAARVRAESGRVTAESQRVTAETARMNAEQVRATAEEVRALAEEGRVAAETARVEAESERVTEWASLRTDVTSATSSANAAATAASEAESDLRAAAARGDFDGYSPTVAIASTDTEHTVTVTDRQGPHSYTVPTYSDEEQAREDAWTQLSQDAQEAIDAATAAAESVSDDVDALYNGIDMLRHDIRTAEVDGGISVTENAAKAVPVDLTVYGVSEQDGTPTPDAPVDIVSAENPVLVMGVGNLFDESALVTGYLGPNGSIATNVNYRVTDFMPIVGSRVYVQQVTTSTAARYVFYDAAKEIKSIVGMTNGYIDVPDDAAYLRITVHTNDLQTAAVFDVISTATLPATLRSLPDGTKDQLNLTYDRPSNRKGWAWYKAEVTRAIGDVDMGALTWVRITNKTNPYFRAALPNSHIYNSNNGMPANKTRIEIGYTWAPGTGCFNYETADQRYNVGTWEIGSNSRYLSVVDKQYETAEAFKAAMAGMEFMYELQAPVTEQLEDMELPILPLNETTVYCTSGSLQPEWHMTYQIDADAELVEVQERVDILEYKTDHMWGNRLTGELTGEVLTANDAYTAPPLEVEVDGKSEQVTTTGKNLFDPDRTPKGYYNTSGAFVANNTYVWWSVLVSEGDVVRWADCTNNLCTTYLDGTIVASYSNQRNSGTITIPAGVDEVRGYSGTATLETAIVTKNNSDLTYEPYTGGKPSPSPDYPQEIVSVANPVVTFAGKNLFGAPTWAEIAALELIGGYRHWPIHLKPNTTYYVSNTEHDGYTSVGTSTYLLFSPDLSNNTWKALAHSTNGATSGTITTDESGIIYLAANSNTTQAKYEAAISGVYTMLTEGSTAVPYEPYVGTTVTLPVTLCSLPDGTRDTLALTYLRPSTREGWAWYSGEVTRATHKVAFSDLSGKGWAKSGSAVNGFYLSCASFEPAMKTKTPNVELKVLSDIAESAATVYIWNTTMNAMYVGNAFNIQLDAALVGSTANEFKSWLATSDATLLYALATPTTETLPEIELPSVVGPSCTIYATADATPTLAVTYERDVTIAIAALEAAIADLATS